VLVDDIDQVTVEDMKAQGLQPAAVVETSHRNCQAWVKSPSLSREESNRRLAQQVGGDRAVPVISIMGGSRDSPTARTLDDRTGRYPGSKWWKQRDKPPAAMIVPLALTRREAERIAREQGRPGSIACLNQEGDRRRVGPGGRAVPSPA